MDRRQKKTRNSIYQAFESLMADKHYSAITVSDIIEKADIGRSTFYAHFETKDDLLEDMCSELFTHIFEGVNEECLAHVNLQDSNLTGVLSHLLFHLQDAHSGVCGKLLIEGEPHFAAYFDQQLDILFRRRIPAPADIDPDLFYSVHIASFVQAITWWFQNDTNISSDKLAIQCAQIWHIE